MPDNYITLSQLTKTTKGLVNKINAESTVTNSKIGDLANLNTTVKTDLVAAINEAAASGTQYDDTALAGRVTALENAGYITSYTETDPTVPSWAKQANKPTYTAAEVGALPSSTTYVSSFNGNTGAITYIAPVTSVNGQTGAVTVDDQNVKQSLVNNASTSFYPMLFSSSNGSSETVTTTYKDTSFCYQPSRQRITVGNIQIGSVSSPGTISLGSISFTAPTDTTTNTITLPNASGTVALTTDIPSISSWALSPSKPTYTASEVGALASNTTYVSTFNGQSGAITYTAPVTSVNGQTGAVTLTIPAAQVQSDWNATSGMGVILNKPTIPAATTVTNTLASGTLIATINGTNIYAPAYIDADGVSY